MGAKASAPQVKIARVYNADAFVVTLVNAGIFSPSWYLAYSDKDSYYYDLIQRTVGVRHLLESTAYDTSLRAVMTRFGVYDKERDAFVHFESSVTLDGDSSQFILVDEFSPETIELLQRRLAVSPCITVSSDQLSR